MTAHAMYKKIPLINSEASLLIAVCAFLISTVSFCGGLGVHFFGLDITKMAFISFWVFDVAVITMLLTPWMKLPALSQLNRYKRLEFMIEIWVWIYILIALTYEVPWVFGYDEISYAEDELWAFPWWSYIHGGDIRYLYVELDILYAEAWACLNACIASVALYKWYKSGRTSTTAVYMLMFGAGMHICPTVQYYTLEIYHGFPNVDSGNLNNLLGKFIFSNSPWLIMPFVVFTWGTQALPRLYGAIKDEK
ncbi:MAG: hypothetical protein KAG18_04805 [Sinobacterium sp.]|nr:hypothetical protein [Sinobacterium sp.]